MMTTKDKINEALGLDGGMSIDEMLADMSVETQENADKLNEMSDEINAEMQKVDIQLKEASSDMSMLKISDLDKSMKEIEDLICESKKVFFHITQNITSSELLDSELIGSCAKYLEALHINIADFVSLYRDKQKFLEKIKLMIFQQNQKKELMELKHQQTLEILKMKTDADAIDTTGMTSSGFGQSQEDITKLLSKMTGAQLDSMLDNKDAILDDKQLSIDESQKQEDIKEKNT